VGGQIVHTCPSGFAASSRHYYLFFAIIHDVALSKFLIRGSTSTLATAKAISYRFASVVRRPPWSSQGRTTARQALAFAALSGFVRMPDGVRDDGNRQLAWFFDPPASLAT
jgi:hypothetical protein